MPLADEHIGSQRTQPSRSLPTLRPPQEARPLVFAYCRGPRSKTPAENRAWRTLGASVNSMTLGPEAVLAAELGIPAAAVVVGHKRSLGSEKAKAKAKADEAGAVGAMATAVGLVDSDALSSAETSSEAPPPTAAEIDR